MLRPYPIIRVLSEDDVQEITELKSREGDTQRGWGRRFQWQFLNNPARLADRPLGWVIEGTEGSIQGHQMAIPQRLKVLDSDRFVAFSGDTYVSPSLRGQGLGKKLFEFYFEAQKGGLAVTSTANPASEYLWVQRFGAIPIGDLNKGFIFVFKSGPILRELVMRWFHHGRVLQRGAIIAGFFRDMFYAKRPPVVPGSILCEETTPHETLLDKVWEQYRDEYQITTVRDRAYRVWRYAQVPGEKPSIWLVRDTASNLKAWFSIRVAVRGLSRAKIAELLDVFGATGEPQFQRHVMACAIRCGHEMGADAIEVKGLKHSWRVSLLSLGFATRVLPSNPFLCRNMGLLKEEVLRTVPNWHLCSADGDAAL